jgi:hypothetical protein
MDGIATKITYLTQTAVVWLMKRQSAFGERSGVIILLLWFRKNHHGDSFSFAARKNNEDPLLLHIFLLIDQRALRKHFA